MRHVLTLFAITAMISLNAQSVTGLWNENTFNGGLGHHGKLKYDESISIWQDVELDGLGPLMRRVRYQRSGETQWHEIDGISDTIVYGDYTLYADIHGLEWDPNEPAAWNIDIYYIDEDGDIIPELRTLFQGITTRENAHIEVLSLPGPYTNDEVMQYVVQVQRDYNLSLLSEVVLKLARPNGMFYEEAQPIQDVGTDIQTVTLTVYPWYSELLCAEIYVRRSDLQYYDFSNVAVEWADVWVPCTEWDGASTAAVDEAALPVFNVFPNPTEGQLTIENLDSTLAIEIRDAAGRLVRQFQPNSRTVVHDVSDLAAGAYSLHQATRTVTKFVKL